MSCREATFECWRNRAPAQLPPLGQVYATIRRRAIDLARSNDRRSEREEATVREAPQSWFDESLEERERARLLQQAMTVLPQSYREVITLKVWGGLTFQEVAQALEIPANTAASRYRYGLDHLRRALKEVLA